MDRHRAPTGQGCERAGELVRIGERLTQGRQTTVAAICQGGGDEADPVRRPPAFTGEVRTDEVEQLRLSALAGSEDRVDAGTVERVPRRDDAPRRDGGSEQRRGESPPLDLVRTSVDIDLQLDRVTAAERRHERTRASDRSERGDLCSSPLPGARSCQRAHGASLPRVPRVSRRVGYPTSGWMRSRAAAFYRPLLAARVCLASLRWATLAPA